MKTRRSFISEMIRAGIGAAILPGATTYARRWIAENGVFRRNPDWVHAEIEVVFVMAMPPSGFKFVHPILFKRPSVSC